MPTRQKKGAVQKLQNHALNKLYQQNQPMGIKALFYAKNLLLNGGLVDVIFNEDSSRDMFQSTLFEYEPVLRSMGLSEYTEDIYDREDRIEAVIELLLEGHGHKQLEQHPPHHANLKRLGKQFGLDTIDLSIIAFLVEHKIEKGLKSITEILGEINIQQCAMLISVAAGLDSSSVEKALEPHSKLVSSGLVCLENQIVMIEETFSDKLNLLGGLAEHLYTKRGLMSCMQHLVYPSTAAKLEAQQFQHLDPLYSDLSCLCQTSRPLNILLHGKPGVGKSELVRTLSHTMGKNLYEVTSTDEDGDPVQGHHRLRAYQVSQQLLKHPDNKNLICFDEIEDLFPIDSHHLFFGRSTSSRSSLGKAYINRILEAPNVTTFWVSNQVEQIDPAYLRRFDLVTEIKGPTQEARTKIIKNLASDLPLSEAWIKQLAKHHQLQPGHIEQAAKSVTEMMNLFKGNEQQRCAESERLMGLFLKGTQQATGSTLTIKTQNTHAQPPYSLKHLNSTTDINQMIQGLKRSHEGRIALYGPSGTGKTALGKYISEQVGRPLLLRKASDLIDMYIGESEKNIATMFEQAQQESAVLLLDEGDSFLRSREGARNSWEVTQVNELLTQMESFDGVFILSTNLMETLDSATLRRFDFKIHLDHMKPEQCWSLFNQASKQLNLKQEQVSKVKQQVELLELLTPGDFQAVMRRNHVMQSLVTIRDLSEALKEECMAKPGAQRNPVGFV
ncbi:MAG: ATP-binding protein [Gammaproteobacteria bacterium]|jgi:SpoVK/Ycf46/Vps4 family AAA+-type ATPase|nr:ATP-binding protein [Gammaproteobacteria bacterium]MBT4606829.1 ATP-binding protein [Thiotrichales bacterium]MBT5467906.1 ATP-binding protein [Candidatus Neomarinimicrobiota bacterium]MBT4328413.1 ATP-binding protein [Gammaproteobacteria bacterium]MBT5372849.1 ATP-binding protein [Gammaproteobacteria bacterium]